MADSIRFWYLGRYFRRKNANVMEMIGPSPDAPGRVLSSYHTTWAIHHLPVEVWKNVNHSVGPALLTEDLNKDSSLPNASFQFSPAKFWGPKLGHMP
jgi:hypothetical protein